MTPPLGPFGYLVEYLFELGPVKSGAAIEPPDLPGWEYVLGVEFSPWEMRALIQLSRMYQTEMHEAEDWHREPPYRGAANQWRRIRQRQSAQNEGRIKSVAREEAEVERKMKGKPRNGSRQ